MKRMVARAAPARLLDALETDGGWLTEAGLGLLLPTVAPKTIERALYRLRQGGLVEDRMVFLAAAESPRPPMVHGSSERTMNPEHRREWRFKP